MSSVLSPRVESEAPTSWGPATVPVSVAPAYPRLVTPAATSAPVAVAKPRRLADAVGLSAECIAADAAYNESVAVWTGDFEKLEAMKSHAFDGPESVSLTDLVKRRDAINTGELKSAQTAVKLDRDYNGRAAARAADLKLHVENCEDDLAAAEKSVTKKLNEIGISVESQPAYRDNPTAAERTFAGRVRESSEWVTAFQKLGTAKATHQAAVEAVAAGRAQLAKAEAYLAATVKRLAC